MSETTQTSYLVAWYDREHHDAREYYEDDYESEAAALAEIIRTSRPPYIEVKNLNKVYFSIVEVEYQTINGVRDSMDVIEIVDTIEAVDANKLTNRGDRR